MLFKIGSATMLLLLDLSDVLNKQHSLGQGTEKLFQAGIKGWKVSQ